MADETRTRQGRFEPLFTDEQDDRFLAEITKCARRGELSSLGNKGCIEKIIDMKDEDGNLVFYDARGDNPDKTKPANYDAARSRFGKVIQDWRKEIAPRLKGQLIEAVVAQVDNAKNSPASLKAVASIIEPEIDQKEGVNIAVIISDKLKTLLCELDTVPLRAIPETIGAGEDSVHAGIGDKGYALSLPSHIGTPGCTPGEEVPFPDDGVVHVDSGDESLQGSPVSCATRVSENDIDNIGGDDMVDTERPEYESND